MLKILISGVAGFIGSHMAERLLQKGYAVTGIDNFSNLYSLSMYRDTVTSLYKNKNFEFIKTDILDKKSVFTVIRNRSINYLIHCAAKTGIAASLDDPLIYLETNVMGTINLLEGLRLFSPKTKSILLSSSSVYGKQDKTPLTEDITPNPLSPYGLSKYLMELIAKQYFYLYKLPIVIVRPFSIYGPRGRHDMAPYLIIDTARKKGVFTIYGNSANNQRSWTYIDDFIEGIMQVVLKHNFQTFEIFNLGNNHSLGIGQFTLIAKKLLKKYLNLNLKTIKKSRRSFEMTINCPSIEKAQRILGYTPKVQFNTGFTKILQSLPNEKNS